MEYWQKAAQIVGDAPSTLNIVYPEVYLAEGDARIERIRRAMADYMQRGVLQTRVKNGFVFVRRVTESGERLGLVGKLDLEQYIRARPRDGGNDPLAHSAARAHPSGRAD